MRLRELTEKIEILQENHLGNPQVESIAFDSRKVNEGCLFVAIKGSNSDGHNYIDDAIERGAVAVICEEPSHLSKEVPIFVTPESKEALWRVASAFWDNPSQKIKVVGVTGTNGKSTTVTLLYHLFTKLGYRCGLISTIRNMVGEREYPTTLTTPDILTLNRLLFEMGEVGCEFCFMEVSSHALDQQRVGGVEFTGAIFTNLGRDHLDYHANMREYLYSKKRLFDNLSPKAFALINSDDRNGAVMLQNCRGAHYTYALHTQANFNCRVIEQSLEGMLVNIDGKEIWSRFIGDYNGYNLLAAYSAATLLGADSQEAAVALSSLPLVEGRMEYYTGGDEITAIVDYAHTADALDSILKNLRKIAPDREIVTLFGCGGGRDRGKRVKMAEVVARYSNRVVVTSDNPRFEEPEAIVEEILKGFRPNELKKVLTIVNRREAIKTALSIASSGAIVLIAGKGHEVYQEIKGVRYHFDDREEVKAFFNL
ncbi:MAG: UDP-N-acetylmuramoyl-L-alanyl-D-glutamate--2,6-diaminopimelate ligase [Bacteroidales bacterium]